MQFASVKFYRNEDIFYEWPCTRYDLLAFGTGTVKCFILNTFHPTRLQLLHVPVEMYRKEIAIQ